MLAHLKIYIANVRHIEAIFDHVKIQHIPINLEHMFLKIGRRVPKAVWNFSEFDFHHVELSVIRSFWPDVRSAAAVAVGGPAEAGGGHQEDQRRPSCRGPQGAVAVIKNSGLLGTFFNMGGSPISKPLLNKNTLQITLKFPCYHQKIYIRDSQKGGVGGLLFGKNSQISHNFLLRLP